jgi:hypothetical protein
VTGRIIIADASKVSPAEFLRYVLGEPRVDPLHKLCADLWDAAGRGDRAECQRLREEIKALSSSPYDLEARRNDDGSYSVAA